MTHLDPSSLARYNSLTDPNLQSYFSSDRIRSHLKHAGLITGQGEIIPDGEYRTRLARREHRKHVRNMLAENIVNRAVDIERARRAEMKRQYEMVAKAALVNNIKETRRRSVQFLGPMANSSGMGLLTVDSCWEQVRPKSASYRNEIPNEQFPISRVKSAHIEGDRQRKYSSKSRAHRRRRSRVQSKSRSPSTRNLQSSNNPCEIRMIYYGPKIKVDYDHLVFEPIDEVVIMQQHCGGESITVYKDHLKSGAEFTFESRRHADYSFGLTLYVKGYIDSRISTCCEYKHRHGVRLGGDRGHFAIISVNGSKPCVKCRFEKQARLRKYADTEKDKEDRNPIIISLPISDEPKGNQESVLIPVRSTSTTNENYQDDFDGSDRRKPSTRDDYSTDTSVKRSNRDERKSVPKVTKRTSSAVVRKEKSSTTSDDTAREKLKKKTWQIIFHTSNIPNARNLLLKFSFLANDEENQTEIYEINMNQLNKHIKADKQYSFPVQLKDIGQPEQIRLKLQRIKDDHDDDDDDDEDIQWHLDHIELIDSESQSHSIFPCRQMIQLSREKVLQLSSKNSRSKQKSSSSDSSREASPKPVRKPRKSSHSSSSSISSKPSPTKSNSARQMSPSISSDRTPKSSLPTDRDKSIRYRVTIYPSNEADGNFDPDRDSRIFLSVDQQSNEIDLPRKPCPTFHAGEKQTFELDLIQNNEEKPKKLTIGYVNQNRRASKWKIDKIVLVNTKTNEQTTFPCGEILHRNDSNFRAEKTFEYQSSDDENTPRNSEDISPKSNHFESTRQRKSANKSDDDDDEKPKPNGRFEHRPSANESTTDQEKPIETPKQDQRRSPSIHSANEDEKPKVNEKPKERSPSFQSMNEDDAHYKTIFKQLDPNNELKLGSRAPSPAPRPRTRHGREEQNTQQQPIVPPIRLDNLGDQTGRSNDQQNPSSLPSSLTNTTENQSRRMHSTNRNDADDEEN